MMNKEVFIALAEIIVNPINYLTHENCVRKGFYFCDMNGDALDKITEILKNTGELEKFFGYFREMPKESHPSCSVGDCRNAKDMLWLAAILFLTENIVIK